MSEFKIAEKFISINGESVRSGQLAVFIRFCGCNLRCSYCDTMWANNLNVPFEILDEDEIYSYIKSTNISNVTLTGGEPLIQKDMLVLLKKLATDESLNVEIETNGSIDLKPILNIEKRPSITIDYKLPGSGMEKNMFLYNFTQLTKLDTVKFVASNIEDLEKVKVIIEKFQLVNKCNIYLSPVFGKIEPETIVEFMKKNCINGVNFQLQLHKIIWHPDKKGV